MPCTAIGPIPVSATPQDIDMIATSYVMGLVNEDYICMSELEEAKNATIVRINLFLNTGD